MKRQFERLCVLGSTKQKIMKVFLASLAIVLASASLFASGFSILEQSVPGLGRGLAGMSASTDDPSALYFNPAGAAWVERPTLMTGMHILTGRVKFHDDGSTIPGHKSGDFIRQTEIPNLDYVYPIGDGLNLNLATSATSGTATNYHPQWVGRYFGIDTSIAVLEVLPSISYKLSDELAVGVGFYCDYAQMKARQNIPTAQYGNDTRLRLEGDSWNYGFTFGLVWKPSDDTSVGIGYRSETDQELRLDSKFYHIPEIIDLGKRYKDQATLKLKTPQNINLGIQQKITDRLTLMFDVSWSDWSVMKEMKTTFRKGHLVKENTSVMNWHDSWRFSLGGEYKINDKWTVRCGTTFDERAVTKHTTKTVALPDTNRYWICCGFSYQWNEHLRIDVSAQHLFFQPSHSKQTLAEGQYIKGSYEGYTNLYSAGIKYEF